MEKKRCELELSVESYFGLKNVTNETHQIVTDYGQLVNLLAMHKEQTIKDSDVHFKDLYHMVKNGEFSGVEVLDHLKMYYVLKARQD